MPLEMKGKRLALQPGQDPYFVVKDPGDYCGPIMGFSGDKPSVCFMLPISRDDNLSELARSLHQVCSPPHTFTEEPDGTLTIRNSIGAGPNGNYYWHGYLTRGNWQLNP